MKKKKIINYIILLERLISKRVDYEKEKYIKEVCDLINNYYTEKNIDEIVENDGVPILEELVSDYIGL